MREQRFQLFDGDCFGYVAIAAVNGGGTQQRIINRFFRGIDNRFEQGRKRILA